MNGKLVISAWCRDNFNAQLSGSEIEHTGYVPKGLGIGGGDSVELTIDLQTGQIIGWKPLTPEQVEEIFIDMKG